MGNLSLVCRRDETANLNFPEVEKTQMVGLFQYQWLCC